MLSSPVILSDSGFAESLANHVMNNDVMSYSQKWRHMETVFADSVILW